MSGSIMSVIYGTPVTDQMLDEMKRIIQEREELPDGGLPQRLSDFYQVEWLYAADGPDIGYIGVELSKGGCHGSRNLDASPMPKATSDQKKEALSKIASLPPVLREMADIAGHYIVFSDY